MLWIILTLESPWRCMRMKVGNPAHRITTLTLLGNLLFIFYRRVSGINEFTSVIIVFERR